MTLAQRFVLDAAAYGVRGFRESEHGGVVFSRPDLLPEELRSRLASILPRHAYLFPVGTADQLRGAKRISDPAEREIAHQLRGELRNVATRGFAHRPSTIERLERALENDRVRQRSKPVSRTIRRLVR